MYLCVSDSAGRIGHSLRKRRSAQTSSVTLFGFKLDTHMLCGLRRRCSISNCDLPRHFWKHRSDSQCSGTKPALPNKCNITALRCRAWGYRGVESLVQTACSSYGVSRSSHKNQSRFIFRHVFKATLASSRIRTSRRQFNTSANRTGVLFFFFRLSLFRVFFDLMLDRLNRSVRRSIARLE